MPHQARVDSLRAALGPDVVGLVHGRLRPEDKDAAMAAFVAACKRDRLARAERPRGRLASGLAVFALGSLAWAGFAFFGHEYLFGVRRFG